MSNLLAIGMYTDIRSCRSSDSIPRPARTIALEVRRLERQAASLLRDELNDSTPAFRTAGMLGRTEPDWTSALNAIKTLLETGEPRAATQDSA
jgi:hypothetical protein